MKLKFLLAAWFLLGVVGSVLAQDIFLSTCSHATAQILLDQARQAYQNRLDAAQAQRAVHYYRQSIEADPACVGNRVQGAEAAWWAGDDAIDRTEKLNLFQTGIDWAQQAIRLDSESVGAHYWLAVNYGAFGETKGVMKSLFLVKPMRRELDEVIKRNPVFLKGGAYRLQGILDYKVPPVVGGSKKRALEKLHLALQFGPDDPFNLYYLAEYWSVRGDKKQARDWLNKLEALSEMGKNDPEISKMQKKGMALENRL